MKTGGLALAMAIALSSAVPAFAEGTKTALEEAVALFEAGKFDEALAATNQVAADDPARPKAAYLAGEIRLATGDAAGAETPLREALAARPTSAPVLGALGRSLLLQGKHDEAIETLGKATAADGKTARYRAWAGLAHLRAGHADVAKKEIAAAEKAEPGDPEVARAAVEERLAAKDFGGAMSAANAFGKAKKDHALGPFLVGFVHDRNGKFDEAIAAYQKAIKLDADFLDARKNLAILCVAQNPMYSIPARTKIAMEQFEEYEKRGGKDPEVLQVYSQLKSFMKSQGGK